MKPWETSLSTIPAKVDVHLTRLRANPKTDYTTLPDVERVRADTIANPGSRAEFLASRAFLRSLLAQRLGRHLGKVEIVQDPNEKPRLAGDEVKFSLSRRDWWCAVALSGDCPVGVDLEPIRPVSSMNDVVGWFFPPEAKAAFYASAPEERLVVFFRWWTRIEASVKATGRGIDASVTALDEVTHQSYETLKGVALAVAAKSEGPLVVNWAHSKEPRSTNR